MAHAHPVLWQWLLAMSRYRAACSPAPNFAFALVTRKTPPHVRDTLDLSGVRVRLLSRCIALSDTCGLTVY